MKTLQLFGVAGLSLVLVGAQFAFTVDNTDASAIYADIQAMWPDWAAAGNQVLGSAKDEYPDAWTQLAAIYGTTRLPELFDVALARTAAGVLASAHAETTVWDRNAGDHAQYTFGIRDVSVLTSAILPSLTDSAQKPSTTPLETSATGSSPVTRASDSSSATTTLTESSSLGSAAVTISLNARALCCFLALIAAMLLLL